MLNCLGSEDERKYERCHLDLGLLNMEETGHEFGKL